MSAPQPHASYIADSLFAVYVASNKVDTECIRRICTLFFISGYNVPVHPAVKAIVMLKSKILLRSTPLTVYVNCAVSVIRETILHQHLSIHFSSSSIHLTHSWPPGQIYSCGMQSLSSHLSVTLSENACCHRTPTRWHVYTHTHRNTHTNILYWRRLVDVHTA